ncbi:MAG: peptidoglycan-binding protein [Desulfovibrionaceae bacterium]
MKKMILFAIALSLVFVWGCSKKVKTEPETVVVKEQEVDKVLTPMQRYEQDYAQLPTSHSVVKGECLWWIAEYKQIYNDPFMWPLIYKANRDQIKNPDLIYPGQSFSVPRAFGLDEVKENRKMAGAPWKALEPGADAVIPAEMRANLGYGF